MLPIDLLSKVPWVPLQRPSLLGPTARLGQCLTWLLCLLQSKKDSGLAGRGGPRAVSSARGLVRERANLSICPLQGSWPAPRPAVAERDLMASEDQRAVPWLRVGSAWTP